MKNRNIIKYALIPLALAASTNSSAINDGWFGYFANNNKIHENSDHTNITFIWASYANKNTARSQILADLSVAKARNIKAVVDVSAFIFSSGTASGGSKSCPFSSSTSASTDFANLVNDLVSYGYLVPGNPNASTVVAFNPVDEPELCGMKDQGNNPHPNLSAAVNIIKSNPNTYNFPLFVILSKKYSDAVRGMNLFDWIGMDNYATDANGYINSFNSFQNLVAPGKKTFLVPQASQGGMMGSYGSPHDPEPILDKYLSDTRVIGIMPFLWYHHDTTGVSGIPHLKSKYKEIGDHIVHGIPLSLKANFFCHGGGGIFECMAEVSRGTPPYAYSWNPTPYPLNFGDAATFQLSCGTNHTIMLTVTDSQNNSVSRQRTVYCAPGSQPVGTPDDGT